MFFATQLVGFGAGNAVVNPDEIGATLWGWWAPDSMNGTTTLTSWTDKSGNGRTLTPVSSNPGKGTGGPNGYAHVDIDTASVSGGEALEGTDSTAGLTDCHVFAVMRIDSYTTSRFLLYGDNDAGTGTKAIVRVAAGSNTLQALTNITTTGDVTVSWSAANEPAAGSWGLVESFLEEGVSIGINVDDGTAQTASISGQTVTSSGVRDGLTVADSGANNEGCDSSYSEIIFYSQKLTTNQRQNVIDYLVAKYGAIGSW